MSIYIAIAYKGGRLSGPQSVVCVRESENAAIEEAKLHAGDSYGVMVYSTPEAWGDSIRPSDWRALRAVYTALLEGDPNLGIVAYLPSRKKEGVADFLKGEEEE
jgi:hypothetical protein